MDLAEQVPPSPEIPSDEQSNLPEEYGEGQSEKFGYLLTEVSNGLITESMIKEEELLRETNENENAANVNAFYPQIQELTEEERLQKIFKILDRSEFYAKAVREKIDASRKTARKDSKKKTKKENGAEATTSRARNSNGLARKRTYAEMSNCQVVLSDCIKAKKVKPDPEQPKLLTGGQLRKYQLDGFQWMKALFENGMNGILGDEMGLGKTIQCIALLAHLVQMGVSGPFLVCAPLSTLHNWVSEFGRFAPKIPVLLYHGSKHERHAAAKRFRKLHVFDTYSAYPVIVTSYEIIIKDFTTMRGLFWKYIIVDEGHRVKNLKCKLLECLMGIPSTNRLILTGTPLQNNLSELFSLLRFLMPKVFDDLDVFESWFNPSALCADGMDEHIVAQESKNHVLSTFHQILQPFLLRRVKKDVELHLPPKREILIHAPVTAKQQKHFEKIRVEIVQCLERRTNQMTNKDFWDETVPVYEERTRRSRKREYIPDTRHWNKEKKISLANSLWELRKCSNHPYLLEYPPKLTMDRYPVDEALVESSGKFIVLDILLKNLKERGHKVLIFSQMVQICDILCDFCEFRGYNYRTLDGRDRLDYRTDAISDFNTNPDIFAFLISTKAGGLGINLTAADTVIIFDSDWNPQNDLQAQDRCHRIGQTRPVVVYRLVTTGSVDERIVQRAAAKRKLEKMIIHQDKFKNFCFGADTPGLEPETLLKLLKSKDHQLTIHSNGQEVFDKDELEVLLDRNFSTKGPLTASAQNSSSRFKVLSEEGIKQ